MNRMLVVGGSGFIGGHLCRIAKARGYAVSALSLHKPLSPLEGVRYLVANLADRAAIDRQLAKQAFEYVVNCGGYVDHRSYFSGGRDVIDAHFGGVQNLLDALDRYCLKRYVQIGSSDEYGAAAAPQSERSREAPISAYSLAKVAATHILQMLWRAEQFPAVTLRLFLTYGPGQGEQRFVPQIISGCLQDRRFPVSEGGQQRDFCYVDDVVEGILRSLEPPAVCGRVINLASGVPVTIRAAVERIRSLVGRGQPDFGQISYRAGENMALWADVNVARELLGWVPQVPLEEGLARTIRHFRGKASAI
jgi:UDP-glucose 4-epimerase